MKKRYLIIAAVIGMIVLSTSLFPSIRPVRPFIQLPGEVYPGTEGDLFGVGLTNTFVASLVTYLLVILIAVLAKARQRTADEVPTGFYNFLEMVIEGAYGFAERIAGPKKVKDFFPFFMSYILIILVANWMGLLPGVDSLGIWEYKPHFYALKEAKAEGIDKDSAGYEDFLHHVEEEVDAENLGDFRNGPFLIRADINGDPNAEVGHADEHQKTGVNPEAADWTIVPFLRPAATDLNLTLAFALIAMFMVQYYGFKYQGARGYLSKFFPFIGKGYGAQVAKNPIKAIDPAVGLLELISEISKIISFAFRLLGNIFAGMVLLFVMAYLLPAANIVFAGLEFFVGLIQALVFALLMLIFMVGATESHHGDDEHGHEHH
ncbi:MAG: F0F1 ATP synthase subunit A [Chloroflexi bacterium]|nr:F0F1 ATP synthase subunit A [Chloroflexota bacterium]